ncbi:MAG: hypothetical protein IJ298_01985 [Ruminococcus sp.]|nr:hypothetical protein [Ruminococcus sp.]
MKIGKKLKITKIAGIILFITLVVSVVYSFVNFLFAPAELADAQPYEKLKSDYLLMTTQCLLGIVVMTLPALLDRKWKIVVPNAIVVLYYAFLYCAIYLGEVHSFYYLIPHWDTILHAFSGAMLGALGFILVDILNKDKNVSVSLSPLFLSIFAFAFALAVGALWEIYEYSFDAVLGLNMQKHTTEAGVALAGTQALADTMKDLIIDALAAFAVSAVGFVISKAKRREKPNTEK